MKFYKFFHSFFFTFKKYYDECQNPFKFGWWLDRVSHVISLDGKAHVFIEPFLREIKKTNWRPPKEYDFFEFLLQLKKWNDTLWGKYWIKKIYWGIYRTRTRDGPDLGWSLHNRQRKMKKKSLFIFWQVLSGSKGSNLGPSYLWCGFGRCSHMMKKDHPHPYGP